MRISARIDYSCRALLELSLHYPKQDPIHIQDIAMRQCMPLKYTIQILNQLRRIGLVGSIRGREGGYLLKKAPNHISLGQVIREIGGPLLPVTNSNMQNRPVFSAIWNEVEDVMARVLDKVTFDDVVNKARKIDGAVNYQI